MPYQGRQPGVGVRNRFLYTATASQTTFSGADSNGRTLAYQDGAYVDVYLNGVMLVPSTDFTATTKTSVSLTSGAAASDIVEIIAYDISSIADTVSALNGGSFGGAVAVSGNLTVDTDTLFVDATNNEVGIGTTSPNATLEVAGGANNGLVRIGQLQFKNLSGSYSANTDGVYIFPFSDGNTYLDNFDGGWVFRTGASTERARLDASGTLGLNVTPSVWNTAFDGRFQFGVQGVLASTSTSSQIGLNWYYDGAYRYIGTGEASRFYQLGGGFFFENAASGTAGGSFSFTERMRIDSSGNVGIGLTNPGVPLHVKGQTNGNVMIVDATGTAANYIFDVRDDGTSVMRVDASGNLLVGTTTAGVSRIYAPATGNLHGIRGTADTAGYVGIYGEHSVNSSTAYAAYFVNNASGTGIYISNTAAWQSFSDARLKEDVKDLDTTERLMQLRPVDYLWKRQATSDDPDRRNFGFIAQEVQEVFPELVSTSPDGVFGVEYTGLIAPLVKAIQEQQAIIEALEARITALEA